VRYGQFCALGGLREDVGVSEEGIRSPSELIDVDDPVWPWLRGLIDVTPIDVIVNPPAADSTSCIWALQVTAGSTLGALAVHTGGIKVDHGWLRILGGGGSDLPDLAAANGLGLPPDNVSSRRCSSSA